ncbi:hypothetical protein PSTG_02935 [Puccinia striiformis f. sp. tritici PST-78]|uniref:Uncharacterized protein n=1 Tax=Puccinia striiformis f. sp. tritici PST-78 TaxID=1165861 RepID=A0A0L0VX55_9BASI|nr:hypothetical protein PSTG_02935 [Puccinia striiformis f. sp. tritici PST-78]
MNVTSLGARARNGASIRLSPPVCFALNGILVALMFTPGALLLWVSVDGANALRAIEHSSRKIIALLLQSAPTYRPENYSYLSVLEIAKPIVAIFPNIKRFAYDLRFMLYLFLVQHSLIAVLFAPTRKVSQFSDPRWILVEQVVSHDQFVPLLNEIDSDYVGQSSQGVHGPTAIIGNIILAFLIQNAWETHKKHLKLVVAAAEIYPELAPEGGKSHKVFESSCS